MCLPEPFPIEELKPGQIGYLEAKVPANTFLTGQTLTENPVGKDIESYGNFKLMKPSVFASFYPQTDQPFSTFRKFRMKKLVKARCLKKIIKRFYIFHLPQAVDNLILNDPVVTSQYTSSNALGEGLRLGFLGQLHLEVFSQRLTSEFGTEVTCTAPSVKFRAKFGFQTGADKMAL